MTATLPSWMQPPVTEVAPSAPATIDVRVVRRDLLADDVVGISLAPVNAPPPEWAPGAHIDVHLPNGMIRQYSLCTSDEDGSLRIAVLREPEGRGGSEFLHGDVHEGDLLSISEPRNNFPLVKSPRYLFIAGGIGVTPFLSMIDKARAASADWSLVYLGRSRRSMAFRSAFDQDARARIVARDEQERLDISALLREPQPDTVVYCCGPEALMIAVEESSAGWPVGTVHFERFVPKVIDTRHDTEFEVVLQRSGKTVLVEPGVSILDTVLQVGVPVPRSCGEGTCGTCETVVISGDPDHRDSILTAEDHAANDCMMICVSRAKSRRLVLDL